MWGVKNMLYHGVGTSESGGMATPFVGLGRTNPYTGSLEARVQASNKEQVYELVRPNPFVGGVEFRKCVC